MIGVKELGPISGNYHGVLKPKEARMSEMIVVGPVVVFTILTPLILAAILSRFVRRREDVPLEH